VKSTRLVRFYQGDIVAKINNTSKLATFERYVIGDRSRCIIRWHEAPDGGMALQRIKEDYLVLIKRVEV